MATYTPGLKVVRQVRHRVRRVLPIAGDVLVKVGDRVDAEQIVAQTFMPGDVTPLNLANVLSISPGDVKASLLKQEGEKVEVGELLGADEGDLRPVQERIPLEVGWYARIGLRRHGTGHPPRTADSRSGACLSHAEP